MTATSAPNVREAPKQVPVTNKKKAKIDKYSDKEAKPRNVMYLQQPTQSPIEEITDLLGNLPLNACAELTRRRLACPHPYYWDDSLDGRPEICCPFF